MNLVAICVKSLILLTSLLSYSLNHLIPFYLSKTIQNIPELKNKQTQFSEILIHSAILLQMRGKNYSHKIIKY